MFRNYILIAIRNLMKNKIYVFINILGIGIAIACCIVAYYNVRFHYDFNKQHSQKDQIYKISLTKKIGDRVQSYGITPLTLGPAIGSSLPGIKEVVRYANPTQTIKYGEHVFNKRIGYADTNFFKVFDFTIISGSLNQIENKNNILINQSIAKTCFGDEDPIGKVISIFSDDGKAYRYIVGGIFADLPKNSSFRCQVICSLDNYIEMHNLDEFNWIGWAKATFLLIPDKKNVSIVSEELKKFIPLQNDARKDWMVDSFYLERLEDIPNTGRNLWSNSLKSGLHPAALKVPPMMAIILLVLACLNFMNTSLATSSSRLKEIGIRKTMGSYRRHIMIQFLSENLLVCFLGLLMALLFSTYLIDAFSDMWPDMTLKMNLIESFDLWFFLILLLIITGILAGAYPAFYISRFNPVNILKGKIKYGGAGMVSKILLVLQFSIAIMGLVSAFIFIQNASYQEKLDMGFDKDQVIVVPVSSHSALEGLKNELVNNPLVEKIGVSEEHIGWVNHMRTLRWAEDKQEVRMYEIGKGYFDAMGLKLLMGSKCDNNFKESDRGKAIIVNEKLVNDYAWKDNPIGKKLKMNDTLDLNVVGVVKDFYPNGFWAKIDAMAFRLGEKEKMRFLIVRADGKDLSQLDKDLRNLWSKIFPNEVYGGVYQEQLTSDAKEVNSQIVKIFNFLAIVSILLSLVGLYTLVSLTIIKKTKEMGIRKVMGAPYRSLVKLINRDYIIILFIASVLGGYLGCFASETLMKSVWKYYMNITFTSIFIPISLIITISVMTIFRKVYISTNQNPVDSLRYE